MPAFRDGRLLILAAAAFAFARVAGGALPWFLFYATFGLVLAALAWAWHLERNLDCLIAVDRDRLEVGQELRVRLRVENTSWIPLPWVEVEDDTPGHLVLNSTPRQATSAGVLASRVLEFALRARRRGHYPVGPLKLLTGDGLGLFQVRRQIISRQTVTVYPRVVRISGVPVPLGQPFGHMRTRQKAFQDPSSLADIRPYRPGDSFRYVHWLTSARRGELHLKEFEMNATTQMVICLDLEQKAHVRSDDLDSAETAISVAASLADLGARQGFEVGLLAGGRERHFVPPFRGMRGFQQILEVLARVEAEGHLPLVQMLRSEAATLAPRSTVVLVTARLTAELADVALRLHANHPVMLVLLRAETFAETGLNGVEAAQREGLVALLTGRRIAVYLLNATDDLQRIAEVRMRYTAPRPAAGR